MLPVAQRVNADLERACEFLLAACRQGIDAGLPFSARGGATFRCGFPCLLDLCSSIFVLFRNIISWNSHLSSSPKRQGVFELSARISKFSNVIKGRGD